MEQRLKDRQTADKVRKKLEAKSRLYDAVHNGEELDDYMRLENKLNLILRYFFSEKTALSTLTGKKSTGREKEEEIRVISTEEDRAKDTTVSRWLSFLFPGLGNLSMKNRLRDRFSG